MSSDSTSLLDRGIFFFNSGRYFEAHEAWEDMWREDHGPLRLLWQGLVQAAVGLHHLSRHNVIGGPSQLRKSIEKLDLYAADEAGIDIARLREDLRQVLDLHKVGEAAAVRIIRLKSKPVVVESESAS